MRGQRIVLEDDARLGEIGDELIHVGLRLFAVRALEVGELDESRDPCAAEPR